MRYDDRVRPTWDGEAIAEALGRTSARHDDVTLWTHEPFLEWIGAERRDQAERRRPADADDAMRRDGRRLRARLLARQAGVGILNTPPELLVPPYAGVPSAVLEEAASVHAAAFVDLAAAAGSGRELWDETVEQWVALPAGTPPLRALALRIAGESMAPLLRSGDVVLVELGTTLARGRVVVARHPGSEDGYVCKRVERVGRREVLLSSLDAAYGTVTIPRDDRLVVGTVRLVWRTAMSGGGN
jgi:SOS-response transcriptional repressor LexA